MIPASIRNNNPGAIEGGPSARKFGSTTCELLRWTYTDPKTGKKSQRTNKIATFPTPVHGAAALFDLLYSRYTGSTVEAAITKWCGGYYAGSYTRVLEQKCGVGPKDALTKERVKDAGTAILLAKGMAWQEAGREFPMSDEQWRQAHDMAFGSAAAPEPSADNDVPFPKEGARRKEAVTDAAKKGSVLTGGVVALEGARQAVDKGKEIKAVLEDAKGLVPAVSMAPHVMLAGGIVLAAVLAVVMLRRSA